MKARPRSVENRVAEAMSLHYRELGLKDVERIPVLGRTGPDLTINEMKLVVDVKSRKEISKVIFFPLNWSFSFDSMVGVRLANLPLLWSEMCPAVPLDFRSKTIQDYLAHMEEWTHESEPDGISCIVLHRPEMPIGGAVAVIYSNSRRRLIEHAKQYRNSHPRE